jgi:hypothetical protein
MKFRRKLPCIAARGAENETSHSTDNTGMSMAETEPARQRPAKVLADLDAVMKRISDGAAVDPETSRRIEERANRITAEIRRTRGVMDDDRFQALLHDDDIPAANP